jgi:hypothetical protein
MLLFIKQKQTFMKTILLKWLALPITAAAIFFACKKTDRTAPPPGNEFTVETVKAWFTSQFVHSAEYRNGTKNGADIKMPHWKKGRVYNIGRYQVAEFPLFINNRHVYISEPLPETDAKRVVAGTLYKALFIKAPGGHIETRIVQFTPTHTFLAAKGYDMSSLSFNNYVAQGFKGDVMLFDYDDNFKKGYHFSSGKTKEIHLYNKIAQANRVRHTGVANRTEDSGPLCDNIPIEPNCYYTVHTEYEYACSGGWNPQEGFNPDYCNITQIISVTCELQYCDPVGGNVYEECLNAGNTQEQCMCTVYGIGCDGGGGEEEPPCTPESAQTICDEIAANTHDYDGALRISTSVPETIASNGDVLRERLYEYEFVKSTYLWMTWYYYSIEKGTHKKQPDGSWIWDKLEHSGLSRTGTSPGSTECAINGWVSEISENKLYATTNFKWTMTVHWECLGIPTGTSSKKGNGGKGNIHVNSL